MHRRRQLRFAQIATSCWFCTLLLCLCATVTNSLTCEHCDSASGCPSFNASDCHFGTTLGPCGCCPDCAKGPGEICGGAWGQLGRCGNNTRCIVEVPWLTPYGEYRQTPGVCKEDAEPTVSTTVPTVSTTVSTTEPTVSTTEPTSPAVCRPKCTQHFCADGKNRYCSATDIAFEEVAGRGYCQQTTCKACRLHVSPDCTTCPERLTKRCLRKYFMCIGEHYNRTDIILELSDARARNATGKIICHVPELTEHSAIGPNQTS